MYPLINVFSQVLTKQMPHSQRELQRKFLCKLSLSNRLKIGQTTLFTHISFGQTLSKCYFLLFLSMVDGNIFFWGEHELSEHSEASNFLTDEATKLGLLSNCREFQNVQKAHIILHFPKPRYSWYSNCAVFFAPGVIRYIIYLL